jgi:hypothetical protein
MRPRSLLFAIVILALVPSFAGASSTPPLGSPVVPPSPTKPVAIGTVRPAEPILTFSGAVTNPTPLPLVNEPIPVVCAAECKEFTFTATTTMPFLVAIHGTVTGPNGTFNPNDGFDLYLYGPTGRLVDAANGIGADGQSIAVNKPTPGTYTIVVTFTYAEDPTAAYLGEVRLMSGTTWQPAGCTRTIVGGVRGCFELPVLQAVPAYDLAVSGLPPIASTPLGFPLPLMPGTPTSCYADETLGLADPSVGQLQNPTTRCLRFTSNVRNVGAGTLEVRLPWVKSDGTSGFVPGGCNAEQLVVTSRGEQAVRPAGPCEFHAAHGHFHYKDLIGYSLYQDAGGLPGQRVGTSAKESFCLADDEYFGFGTAGPNGARGFVGQPGCNIPSDTSNGNVFVTMGVTPGWGDVYTWDTPDQFIDITNTPAGTYDLVMETNPHGSLLVAGSAQTCSLTRLTLTADAVHVDATQASITCPTS